MTQFTDVNEMAAFVERIAARSAELTVARLSEVLRAEIGEIRELANRVHQTVYGDNGQGVLGQIARIKGNCELRRQECESALGAVRSLAVRSSGQAVREASGAGRTLERWRWMLAGAMGLLAGIVGTIEALYRLRLLVR